MPRGPASVPTYGQSAGCPLPPRPAACFRPCPCTAAAPGNHTWWEQRAGACHGALRREPRPVRASLVARRPTHPCQNVDPARAQGSWAWRRAALWGLLLGPALRKRSRQCCFLPP